MSSNVFENVTDLSFKYYEFSSIIMDVKTQKSQYLDKKTFFPQVKKLIHDTLKRANLTKNIFQIQVYGVLPHPPGR